MIKEIIPLADNPCEEEVSEILSTRPTLDDLFVLDLEKSGKEEQIDVEQLKPDVDDYLDKDYSLDTFLVIKSDNVNHISDNMDLLSELEQLQETSLCQHNEPSQCLLPDGQKNIHKESPQKNEILTNGCSNVLLQDNKSVTSKNENNLNTSNCSKNSQHFMNLSLLRNSKKKTKQYNNTFQKSHYTSGISLLKDKKQTKSVSLLKNSRHFRAASSLHDIKSKKKVTSLKKNTYTIVSKVQLTEEAIYTANNTAPVDNRYFLYTCIPAVLINL